MVDPTPWLIPRRVRATICPTWGPPLGGPCALAAEDVVDKKAKTPKKPKGGAKAKDAKK